MSRISALVVTFAAALLLLAGCGLYVPEIQEWYEDPKDQKFTENDIISHIKCEIHRGTEQAIDNYKKYRPFWFKTWNANVTLKLSVEESGSLNPGLSWVRPFTNTSFVLGAGASGSSEATRTETISFSYPLTGLLARGRMVNPCSAPGIPMTIGDLKIGQFIDRKLFLTTVPGTIYGEYSAFNYEVSFVVVYSGSITPRWNLVDITVNPNSPFASASRSRTHTVTITFSAPSDPEGKLLHNAALIGQAVAAALKKTER